MHFLSHCFHPTNNTRNHHQTLDYKVYHQRQMDLANNCPNTSPSPPRKCVVCRETLLLFIFLIRGSSESQGPVQQADLLMLRHASSVLQNIRGMPQCVWRVWGDEKRDTSLMTAALGAMNHFFLKTCPLVLHLPNATKSTRDQKS